MRLLACRTFATLALAPPPSRWQQGPSVVRSLSTTTSLLSATLDSDGKKRPRSIAGSTSPSSTTRSTKREASPAATNSVQSAKRPVAAPRRPRSSAEGEGAPSHHKWKRSPLQPYELSGRLITLCQSGDVDLAVTTLQSTPRNAQNVKVWNTLIKQCMDAEKYQLAYSVFTDMKRRGFVPNVRTYATMMNGLAAIEDWEKFSKQLGYAHSVYAQLKRHLEKPHDLVHDPAGASFILYPISLYISILGKAGKYQKAFDVFHELDTDGPLAPHPKVYSSLLCVLADRIDSPDTEPEVVAQSVSDAKYVWRRHMRGLERGLQSHIEPRSVDAVIKVLSRGEPDDHELMFDILHDVCGLPRPGEDRPPSSSSPWVPPKVALTAWILSEALDGCIAAGHPDKTVHYAQSVMSSSREQRAILGLWHLHKLVRAHILLANGGSTSSARAENAAEWVEWMVAQIRDEKKMARAGATVAYALELCYRCEDAKSGLRIARATLEGPMRGSMSVRAWLYLLKLAIVAPREEKRRCLGLLSAHGSALDAWESTSAIERLAPPERKAHVSLALCIVQVLRTVSPSLPPDQENGDGGGGDAELGQREPEVWSDLRRRAESFLENNPSERVYPDRMSSRY